MKKDNSITVAGKRWDKLKTLSKPSLTVEHLIKLLLDPFYTPKKE